MSSYPDRYIIVDTETPRYADGEINPTVDLTFTLGVMKVYDPVAYADLQPRVHQLSRVDDFYMHLNRLPKGKSKIWIFAHNAGFDLRILDFFGRVKRDEFLFWHPDRPPAPGKPYNPKVVLESPPLIIRCWRPDGQEIQISDTVQWLSLGLARIGENLNFPKWEDPGDDAPIQERFAYCERDVEVLDRALQNVWRWLRRQKIRSFHPTRAGQSMLIYKQKYEDRRIKRPEDLSVFHLDRLAYYGGRTDPFYIGEVTGPVYQLDINSLYPHVMSNKWYPCEVVGWDHREGITTDIRRELAESTTAEVWIDSRDEAYPVRCREGTWFVRGRVRTVLPGPELHSALMRRDVVRIGRWTTYRRDMLFNGFVRDFYRMRQEAKARKDVVSDMIIKLLMNSLYGKFAQQETQWRYVRSTGRGWECLEGIECDIDGNPLGRIRDIQGHQWAEVGRTEHEDAFVPIAAYVTSYARVYMDLMREIAGEGHHFYQATDSLYVDEIGYSKLREYGVTHDEKLGRFKLEGAYDSCTFNAVHQLVKDDLRIVGSVKPRSPEVSPNTFAEVHWEDFATALARGCTDRVVLKRFLKKISAPYHRQRVQGDGRCVPWYIDNWDVTPEAMAKESMKKYLRRGEEDPRLF